VYVDERSLYKYTNFLSGISVSAFSSGEILWRIKKSDLNNHSPPFSENIFTGAPLPLSYESYTKKKKKHELCEAQDTKLVSVKGGNSYSNHVLLISFILHNKHSKSQYKILPLEGSSSSF